MAYSREVADCIIALAERGQGVLISGKIQIKIAIANGKNVCWTSEYSAEMRGGSALCRVVISDEDIGKPYPDVLDILCCMIESAYEQYVGQVQDGGAVLVILLINPVSFVKATTRRLEYDLTLIEEQKQILLKEIEAEK